MEARARVVVDDLAVYVRKPQGTELPALESTHPVGGPLRHVSGRIYGVVHHDENAQARRVRCSGDSNRIQQIEITISAQGGRRPHGPN